MKSLYFGSILLPLPLLLQSTISSAFVPGCIDQRNSGVVGTKNRLSRCKSSALQYSSHDDSDQEHENALSQALMLQRQAKMLRKEAEEQTEALRIEQEARIERENRKTDQWIEELLIQCSIDENTEMLNSVDQVFERLKDDRYSQEQVNKIFNRICETGPAQSRSKCSPLMALFVDAVGKLDAVERDENPNKRWSGRVERVLRKKLFALDWGIELEEEDEDNNPWTLR
eukprot:scaffold4095_cov117-Cylindrotheca_fusiformis.AAC.3